MTNSDCTAPCSLTTHVCFFFFLAFYGSNTFYGTAIRAQWLFFLLSTNHTSALETSRLSLMVCEWVEWDSQIPDRNHSDIPQIDHAYNQTSPESRLNSLMHWLKVLFDKKKHLYKGYKLYTFSTYYIEYANTDHWIDVSCLSSCLTF